MVRNINQVYGQQQSKPEMPSTSTSAYPITKTTIATTSTSSTLSPDDNIVAIIKNATEELSSSCFNYLSKRVLPACKDNALTICDYISSLRSEINPSYSYSRDIITLLCSLSIFFKNTKPWIGTYNLYRMQEA